MEHPVADDSVNPSPAAREETLKFLVVAYQERSPWIVFVQNEPVFDFLHSDPRYRALIKKIGLPPAY
jgi:hypothetical protein